MGTGATTKNKRRNSIALYGNVPLERVWCESCQSYTFVKNNVKLCCGEDRTDTADRFERMVEPEFERRIPSKRERDAILEKQDGRCFYCESKIGSIKRRNDKPLTLRLHWDHQLPYAYGANNRAENFVAACHVCNGIKSSHIFQTVEEAKVWLETRRKEKGYNF